MRYRLRATNTVKDVQNQLNWKKSVDRIQKNGLRKKILKYRPIRKMECGKTKKSMEGPIF
jgi:hypothetical protein